MLTYNSPSITPKAIRRFHLFGADFELAYLFDYRAVVPLKGLCAALDLDFEEIFAEYIDSNYLFLAWTNILMPDKNGVPQDTLCLEMSVVPIFLIAVALNFKMQMKRNSLLSALCDDASIVLFEHYHLGDGSKVRARRSSLISDVTDSLGERGGFPDPWNE